MILIKKSAILVILMIFSQRVESCGKGCLSCDILTQKCKICDGRYGFLNQQGQCVKSLIENCILHNEKSPSCLVCEQDYRIENGLCIKKEGEFLHNCLIYKSSNLCHKPKDSYPALDFYFDSNYVKIENCKENDTKSTCSSCNQGFIVSEDKRFCLKQSSFSDQNCLIFSNFQCHSCKDQFFFNKNSYQMKIFHEANLNTAQILLDQFTMTTTRQRIQQENCLSIPDSNCKEYSLLQKCESCKKGYILNDLKECILNPEPSVPNCSKYDQNLECIECEADHILQNGLSCEVVPLKIENCQNYIKINANIQCSICKESFHLSQDQLTCVQRTTYPIENCQSYQISLDQCKTCSEDYILSIDGLSCSQKISNCKVQIGDSQNPQCQECQDTYQLQNNECIKGTIINCKIYDAQGCIECILNYHLSNNECVESPKSLSQKHCLKMNPSNPHDCQTCETYAQRTQLSNECTKLETPIQNCIDYDSSNQCIACASGYNLNNSQCELKQVISGTDCYTQDNSQQCTECHEDYYLDNGQCYRINFYQKQNCLTLSGTGQSTQCIQCDKTSTEVILNGKIGICDIQIKSNYVGSIPNCILYNDDALKSCKSCEKNYVLENGLCIYEHNCNFGIVQNELGVWQDYFFVQSINKCPASDLISNCKTYVPNYQLINGNMNFADNYVCTECKKGYFSVFNNPQGKAHHYSISQDFNERIIPVTECVEESIVTSTLFETNETLQNCEILLRDTNNSTGSIYYACYKCKFGYTGRLKRIHKKFYLSFCQPIINCINNQIFTGFGSLPNQLNIGTFPEVPLSTYMNCHSCMSPLQIPFFGLAGEITSFSVNSQTLNFDVYDYLGFDVKLEVPTERTEKDQQSMEQQFCLDYSLIQSYDPDHYFPENCGGGMVRVNKARKNYSDQDTSFLCLACLPKYKPTLFSHIAYAVEKCELIENCKSSNRYNGCEKCEEGYVLEIDSVTMTPNIEKCVKSVKNCLYADSTGECKICQDGYVLHQNKSCYLIDFDYCNSSTSSKIFPVKKTNTQPQNLTNYLSHSRNYIQGCNQCNTGFVNAEINFDNVKVCMKNPNLFSLDIVDENSISNCILYENDTVVKCKQCQSQFVISLDQKQCFPNTFLYSCQVAESLNDCSQCQSGYYLNSSTKNCNKGLIFGCKDYQDETTCSGCSEGFVLFGNKCFVLPVLNCNDVNFDVNALSCNNCESFYYSLQTISNNYICLPYLDKIENCKTMNNQSICEECQENYYYSSEDNKCYQRTLISQCKTYEISKDLCSQCEEGFRLMKDQLQCKTNPKGVLNCLKHLNSTQCEICKEGMIIHEGKCINIESSQIIENCLLYIKNPDLQCHQCKSGYFVSQNKCLPTKITNCQIFESETKCIQCIDNYSLIEIQGVLDCHKVDKKNCLEVNKFNFCTKCYNGYYSNNQGNCVKVGNIITGCIQYLNQEKCLRCSSDKILSANREKCLDKIIHLSKIDKNCSFLQKSTLQICNRCQKGYYFDESHTCQKCLNESCFFCNPLDSNKCIMCPFGYYMDQSQNCIQDEELIEVKDEVSYDYLMKISIIFLMLSYQLNFKYTQSTQI